MLRSLPVILLILFTSIACVRAQQDSINYKSRRVVFFASSSVLYAGTMATLATVWYSSYEKSSFHWFNDNEEWLQMDKAGHAVTGWALNGALYEGFRYSGYSRREAVVYSWLSANLTMSGIEVLDGFSAGWGASPGDLLANLTGTTIFSLQRFWRDEPWVIPKFSYNRNTLTYLGPFGDGLPENVLKDYNGQTYWLAVPLKSIHSALPEWLCISAGYGADGMAGARNNDMILSEQYIPRYRQYYLSADINLRAIKTKSTFLQTCLHTLNIIRFPFPTLELSQGKLKGHFLYF